MTRVHPLPDHSCHRPWPPTAYTTASSLRQPLTRCARLFFFRLPPTERLKKNCCRQVIEDSDDIGWHWDKDYGMEAQGVNVHPCLATVTYLSTNGGPTVILEKKVSSLNLCCCF